jgi:Na+-transporting NADH:ubiquinone oxidoreductase subunit A
MNVSTIKIRRGLNITLKGKAEKVLAKLPAAESYALKPADFPFLTPRLVVAEGDAVLAGTPLFVDKYRPEVAYVSPVSGVVGAIERGEKRRLLAVVVRPDAETQYVRHATPDPAALTREQLVAHLLAGGVWPFLRQRPYGVVAAPTDVPRAIFISGFCSAPLAADMDFALTGEAVAFQKGIDVLRRLADTVVLGLNSEMAATSIFRKIKGVSKYTFAGPHPAGNVGIQIHHIAPVRKGEVVWTMDPFHVVALGRFFIKGVYDVSKVVALTGSEVLRPRYYRMTAGASLSSVVPCVAGGRRVRFISGDVLSGTNVGAAGHLGFYDSSITVVPESERPEWFGWANPLRLHRYSVARSSLSSLFPDRAYALDTNVNGGERPFVVNGEYEKVLPMNLYPVYLLKAILAGDIDRMEQLGIREVVGEDLALCEFVCTSKIRVQEIVQRGIALMLENE